MRFSVTPVQRLVGELRPPSDKSLTHRAYLFAAIADQPSVVFSPLMGEDCLSTLACLTQLGLSAEWVSKQEVRLQPQADWHQPTRSLDCGNSDTTIRLLSGLIAGRPLDCTLVGDESLSRRPMGRIAEPLRAMGATVEGATPPLRVVGSQLTGIDYVSPVSSAQVKSCVLLAGLGAQGKTSVIEPSLSRDHTERMLRATGVEVVTEGLRVSVAGGQRPHGFSLTVPGDISSAAFFLVAASIIEGSELTVRDLSVNPSRTGILDVFEQVGISIKLRDERDELGEPVADLYLTTPAQRAPFEIQGDLVPRLIDEIPILAILATQCMGTSTIRGARELRVKETDRIEAIATGLRAMGAEVEVFDDGLTISGPVSLRSTVIHAKGDHRIAMAFSIAGLIAEGETVIEGAESIATSYPSFSSDLHRLTHV